MAETFAEGSGRLLAADDVYLEAVGAKLARQCGKDLGHEEVEAGDRPDPSQVADHEDPWALHALLRRRAPLAPRRAGEVGHRVVRIPGLDAVLPSPLGVMAAEDAHASEPAQQRGGAAVGVPGERAPGPAAEHRAGRRGVAQPHAP